MHLTAPSHWSRSIGTGGRDPSERLVTIVGMRRPRIYAAPGVETFNLAIEELPNAQVKLLLRKLDKHHPEMVSFTGEWGRRHIVALADGTVPSAPKSKATPKPKTPRTTPRRRC